MSETKHHHDHEEESWKSKVVKIVLTVVLLIAAVWIEKLLLAIVGLSTMWMAVFADVGVTVLVVLNAMRKLKKV